MSEFIFADDFYTCAKGYQMALDTIYSYEDDRGVKIAYNDVYEEVIDVIYDKADELHDKVAKYAKDNFDVDIDSEADIAKYAKDNFDVDIDSDFSFGEDGAGVLKSIIPTGESFGFSEGVVSDKLKKIKSIIKSKTETMIQNWKEMNERIKIANEKAREPKGYPEPTPEQREAVRVKEFTAFKAMLDEYVSSMEKWVYGNDRETCWAAYLDLSEFFRKTWYAPETALYYGGAYDDVQKYMNETYDKLDDRFIKHMKDNFNEIVPPLKTGTGESHMFKRKYGYTTIDPQAFSEMINTLLETERDTLKAFSESKGISYIAESEDYVITSKTLINTTAVVLAARYKFGFYN